MSIVMQINPFEFFTDGDGDALDDGFIWIGERNKDPRNYPVAVYFDAALTIPAAMPLRTTSGYVYRNGSPTFLYIDGNYSVMVLEKTGRQVYYVPDFLLTGSSGAISIADLASISGGLFLGGPNSIAELRTVPKPITGRTAPFILFVAGYLAAGDGGGGRYLYDPADTTSADNGGTVIVAADGGRWKLMYTESVSVEQFGCLPIPGRDNFTFLSAAVAFCYATKVKLVGGDGTFEYSTTLDLSYPGLEMAGAGMENTTFKFTGAGIAMSALGTRPNNGTLSFGLTLSDFAVMGSSTSTDLIKIRVHHSKLTNINLLESSTINGDGLRVQGCILATFDNVICSTNHQLMTNRPQNGIVIEANPVDGFRATANTFINPIIEGMTGDGIANLAGDQQVFIGGTSENNGGNGITSAASTRNNTYFGSSFESNLGFADIFEAGNGNKYINCASTRLAYIDNSSLFAEINGGLFELITTAASASFPSIEDVKVRFFTGLSAGIAYSGNVTVSSRNIFDVVAGALIFPKVAASAIIVGASPFAYRNGSGKQQTVLIVGGTVTQVTYTRDTAPIGNIQLSGSYVLQPGDGLTVSYSVLPTMTSVLGGTNYN